MDVGTYTFTNMHITITADPEKSVQGLPSFVFIYHWTISGNTLAVDGVPFTRKDEK